MAIVSLGRKAFARTPSAGGVGCTGPLFGLCLLALLAVGVIVTYAFNIGFS